jgi:acyl carrier protein phosphodiesterase
MKNQNSHPEKLLLYPMNFLAHLYLSGSDKDVMLGNLIADSVNGSEFNHYRPGVIEGIRLHRAIDHYTDAHPVVERSKERLRAKYHKFAGVVTDMFYDHYLARDWNQYSDKDLYETTVMAYEILLGNFMILPPRIKKILPFMLASNWLYSYKELPMMERFFAGMSRRTTFYSGMEHAVDDLRAHYDAFGEDFKEFFPDIIDFVNKSSKNINK